MGQISVEIRRLPGSVPRGNQQPDWLDTLAPRCGLPNTAQVRKIQILHERFELKGTPPLRDFSREDDTGMVHGWIGNRLFVGIAPDGSAHS